MPGRVVAQQLAQQPEPPQPLPERQSERERQPNPAQAGGDDVGVVDARARVHLRARWERGSCECAPTQRARVAWCESGRHLCYMASGDVLVAVDALQLEVTK